MRRKDTSTASGVSLSLSMCPFACDVSRAFSISLSGTLRIKVIHRDTGRLPPVDGTAWINRPKKTKNSSSLNRTPSIDSFKAKLLNPSAPEPTSYVQSRPRVNEGGTRILTGNRISRCSQSPASNQNSMNGTNSRPSKKQGEAKPRRNSGRGKSVAGDVRGTGRKKGSKTKVKTKRSGSNDETESAREMLRRTSLYNSRVIVSSVSASRTATPESGRSSVSSTATADIIRPASTTPPVVPSTISSASIVTISAVSNSASDHVSTTIDTAGDPTSRGEEAKLSSQSNEIGGNDPYTTKIYTVLTIFSCLLNDINTWFGRWTLTPTTFPHLSPFSGFELLQEIIELCSETPLSTQGRLVLGVDVESTCFITFILFFFFWVKLLFLALFLRRVIQRQVLNAADSFQDQKDVQREDYCAGLLRYGIFPCQIFGVPWERSAWSRIQTRLE